MSLSWESAANFAAAIGVPLLLLANGVLIAEGFGMSRSVGELSAEARRTADNVARLEASVGDQGRAIESIEERLWRQEADPRRLLVDMGVPVDTDMVAIWVDGRTYTLPMSRDAELRLESAGYERREITPAIDGWVRAPTR
ncbi:hypothetical protein [Salinarimonas ramus]|uniref:Uncharacterized protein n=1 Tax=Salinarimonas ramus TaxID=690164 RepID=A0A917QDX2_9HYPH|nr:hypothetical protein [Salinarimonas ramus]GGK44362.1 hypothetical protein GCM10011322_34430 [Salinarimonas ramus]